MEAGSPADNKETAKCSRAFHTGKSPRGYPVRSLTSQDHVKLLRFGGVQSVAVVQCDSSL